MSRMKKIVVDGEQVRRAKFVVEVPADWDEDRIQEWIDNQDTELGMKHEYDTDVWEYTMTETDGDERVDYTAE